MTGPGVARPGTQVSDAPLHGLSALMIVPILRQLDRAYIRAGCLNPASAGLFIGTPAGKAPLSRGLVNPRWWGMAASRRWQAVPRPKSNFPDLQGKAYFLASQL